MNLDPWQYLHIRTWTEVHHFYPQAFNWSSLWPEVKKVTESRLPTALLGLSSGCHVGLTDQGNLEGRHEAPSPTLSGVQDPLCGTHNREGNDEEHSFSKCAFSMSPSRGGWALSSTDLPKPSVGPNLVWQSQWSQSLFLNGALFSLYSCCPHVWTWKILG